MILTLRRMILIVLIMAVGARAAIPSSHMDTPAQSGTDSALGRSSVPEDAIYPLQAGDVLTVSVWKEQELQSEVLIRPDGGISFPLAGDLRAAGRTVDDVRADLESRLVKFIPDVVVTVAVKTVLGNRIYVIGKVARPGDFSLGRPTDVMQALSLAGGTTPFADLNGIKILRRGEHGKIVAIPFRYKDVQRGQHLEQNILLGGGDTVVVP